MNPIVAINITNLDATIPEGLDVRWHGCAVNSGPLQIHLDDTARGDGDNRGELDYEQNRARARFNIAIDLLGMPRPLADAASWEPVPPIRAVVDAEGVITEDHNFGLSGPMEMLPHPLLGAEGLTAAVLPGR